MALVHVDEELAFDELRSLVSGQWDNGLVPQITFNPNETKYFPGPEFWGTERFATGEIITSGITQPPLLAVSVAYVYQQAKNREKADTFIKELLPAVLKYHEYLKTYRDPEDSGLLTIVHPWESGTDNSPRFDEALEAISLESIPEEVKDIVHRYRTDDKEGVATHRPRIYDYYRYMYLVSLYKEWNWDYERIIQESPFAMKDILFSSVWAKANGSLAVLLRECHREREAEKYHRWAEQTRRALINRWDAGKKIFMDINVSREKKEPIKEDTIASFMPLYAGITHDELLQELLTKLTDPTQYWPSFPVPSTSLASPKFDLARYWRGPSWPITNLFLIDGLHDLPTVPGTEKAKRVILDKTLQMIQKKGFFEYYDPLVGFDEIEDKSVTLGFGSFSWTAAIFIYLFNRRAEYNPSSE